MNINNEELQAALLKRALGYDYEEVEMIASKDGKTTKIKKTKKHVPPDINAMKMYLRLKDN
jgi:hypothetical protein